MIKGLSATVRRLFSHSPADSLIMSNACPTGMSRYRGRAEVRRKLDTRRTQVRQRSVKGCRLPHGEATPVGRARNLSPAVIQLPPDLAPYRNVRICTPDRPLTDRKSVV